MSTHHVDLPNYINTRIENLEDAKTMILARLSAIEGAIREMGELKKTLEAPAPEKKKKEPKNAK